MIIGTYETNDWGILSSYSISSPQIDKKMIDIPGRSGAIDASTSLLGYPTYRNRKIVIKIGIKRATEALVEDVINDIYDKIHGQRLAAIFPFDSNYKYEGRWNIETPVWLSKRIKTIELVCDADPYAYKLNKTSKNIAVGDVSISSDMPTKITIKATATTKFTWEGTQYTFNAGNHVINYPKLLGSKIITFTQGAGTIEYQEGKL